MSSPVTLLQNEALTIEKNKRQYFTGEAGFRDKLCELIGEAITDVSSNKTHFTFVFKNKTKLLFELSMPDDPCPEVAFGDFGGQYFVLFNEPKDSLEHK